MKELDKVHPGRDLIGEVKAVQLELNSLKKHDDFLDEMAILMSKYKVDYLWLFWRRFNGKE